MNRVFLDANVLFSASYLAGSGLNRLWELSDVELITSAFAVSEVLRNLSEASQRERLSGLLAKVTIVPEASTATRLPDAVSLPEKDAPILLAAVVASATHLLTGDKRHFGALFGQSIDGVLIQRPSSFLEGR